MATDAAIKRLLDASQDGLEGRLTMQIPTWNDIASYAMTSLDEALLELSAARDWMDSDWSDGHSPLDPAKPLEAARLIREAKQLIDQAKDALHASAERVA